jgi:ActD protein
MTPRPPIYGLLAEFESPTALVHAAQQANIAGYRRMDAYSPFPIEGLAEMLGYRPTLLSWVVFLGGVLGCVSGYFLQYYTAVIDYPFDVGGRPYHSWPAFIPVTFELTILAAGLFAVLGMFGLNGLPMPYHPVFNVARFARASRDRFFLCIEAADRKFDREATRQFLQGLAAREVTEVEH